MASHWIFFCLQEEERILIIGNTRQPFLCEKGDLKKMNAFFKEFKLFMPPPDYSTMQLILKTLIQRHEGIITEELDIQTLAWICTSSGIGCSCGASETERQ